MDRRVWGGFACSAEAAAQTAKAGSDPLFGTVSTGQFEMERKAMQKLQRQFKRQIGEMVGVCETIALRQYVTSQGGNLSWRVGPGHVLITPTRMNKGKIGFDDIIIVGMDGEVLFAAEGRTPTGEISVHLHIFDKRPDAASIIHAHPVWLTAFALSKPGLLQKPWMPEPVIEVGPVAVTEYAQPLTEELAQKFDPALTRHNAFLMRNHGVVVLCAEGLSRCLELLDMLEVSAKTVAIAKMLGGARPLSPQAVRGLAETVKARNGRLPGAPGEVKDLTDLY